MRKTILNILLATAMVMGASTLPQPSFHIFIIELPTFVFWGYPSEIFRYLSEIISYPSEIFCYLSELCSYPSEIFFRMIP